MTANPSIIKWPSKEQEQLGQLKNFVRMNRAEDAKGKVTLVYLMNNLTAFVREIKPQAAIREDVTTLQCLSLLAEAHDMKGEYGQVKNLIQSYAEDFFVEFTALTKEQAFPDPLRRNTLALAARRKLLRQRVWLVLNYIYLLCHEEEYATARAYLDACDRVVKKILYDASDPAAQFYGTRARIAYLQALIAHEMGHLKEAEEASQEALICAFDRLESKRAQYQKGEIKPEQLEREIVFSQHCVGKIDGYCTARRLRTEGKLTISLQKFRAALMFFSDVSDVNNTFPLRESLELEIAVTLRLMAGKNEAKLLKAKEKIEAIRKGLKENSPLYFRVFLELGFVLIDLAKVQTDDERRRAYLERAETFIDQAELLASQTGRQWRIHILRSRLALARQNTERAEAEANSALCLTTGTWNKMGEIRALIERGKALAAQVSCEKKAIQSFEAAMKEGREHSVIQAQCRVYLARIYYRLGKTRVAVAHLAQWHRYKDGNFENAHIIWHGDQVEKEMASTTESFFILRWQDNQNLSLDFKAHAEQLKKWLTVQAIDALQHTGKTVSEQNIAELLGYKSHASVNETIPKRRGRPPKNTRKKKED
jgi:tetratricopeptide (TPR) repeat protein